MIRTFHDTETAKIFQCEFSRRLPLHIQRPALRKLMMIDAATDLQDIRMPPANHLESLSGNRRGQHSIRINDQWRICFVWRNDNAYEVEIVDYH